MNTIKTGRYRHFKGGEYQVLGVARDAETLRSVVVYRALYGEQSLWVRAIDVFQEFVERDGTRVRRYEYLGD
jgi:hypothetical protein